ncbi:MAG: hypothetical protein NDF55_03695 [archaeon GB-1867-005]|nr:hypothetical protein [Candidatus Culexmicrobium cathedralense]
MKIFIDSNLLIYLNTIKTPEWRKIYENFYLDLLLSYKSIHGRTSPRRTPLHL